MLYNNNGEFKVYNGDEWKKEHLPLKPYAWYIYPEIKYSNYKYFDDFTYNGNVYNLNSLVKLSDEAKKFLGTDSNCTQIVQHEITNTNKERWGYVVRRSSEKTWHVFTTVPPDQLIEEIVTSATSDIHNSKIEYYNDNEVDGMIRAWVIYIIVMIVSIMFNDFIIIWVFASYVFFTYRKQKLTKWPQHNYDL